VRRSTQSIPCTNKEHLLQSAEPTLHDFVLKLLTDPASSQAFDLDPVAALSGAGLSDVTPQDVVDAIPLVLDLASASGGSLGVDSALSGGLDGLNGESSLTSALGGGGFAFGGSTSGMSGEAGFDSLLGGGVAKLGLATDSPELAGELDMASTMGGGVAKFGVNEHGLSTESSGLSFAGGMLRSEGFATGIGPAGLSMESGGSSFGFPLDADAIGKGGDLVTGTVASVVTDGAATLTGFLTEGAGALADGINSGAWTTAGLINQGADQFATTIQDPTSAAHLPGVADAGLGDLPVDLPADLPALPGVPGLPGLPGLPIDLPQLPVDLPQLPIDLPQLPDLPVGLPAVPGLPALPSVPGLDTVHDTVGGLTAQVPLVGDLTDGLDNHLPFGH
jgi:hypothetical protein